jgi:hypothetical protein
MEETNSFNFLKKGPLFAIVVIFLSVMSLSGLMDIYQGMNKPSDHQITFSGIGSVYAKPDLVLTSFSVITEAETVEETMTPNAEKMNEIINAIKEQGVEQNDIKTTDFNIYPRYEYPKSSTYYYESERMLVGYEMTQTVEVKIRDLTKVGEIIQSATDAGANQVGSLQFTIDDQDSLKAEAREKAIQNAKDKAQELASQLGIKLGKIISFSESNYTPYYSYDAKNESSVLGMGGSTPQIETGENKIEANVTIVYELK